MSAPTLLQQPPLAIAAPVDLGFPHVVFAGGGTAGHLYPALAVADVLRRCWPRMPLVFFGSGRAIDAVVLEPQGAELIRQPVRPVAREPWRWPGFLRAWRASTRMCRTRFAQVRPDIVVGSGGYAGGPAIAVAARMGIPTMLLNPDLVPGKANRWLANRVDRICVQFAESRRHFHAEAPLAVTGCPVRPVFGQATRADGIARFGLDPARKTLLVTGASLGARTINTALCGLAENVAARADWQILHLAGRDDAAAVTAAYVRAKAPGRVLDYTPHMAEAMATADLMIARAGASTVAEVQATGTPTIFLPYPHHRDQHQRAHAQLLARRGMAQVVEDGGANTAANLEKALFDLMDHDDARARMRTAARTNRCADAAEHVARCVIELLPRRYRGAGEGAIGAVRRSVVVG
jgi:UDP-N-acetylglucosamine--N-acetylmuramyl-(pentapeptide) pyrophosphoryl-undecaprenol N-acetylglucosamine transferase